MQITRDQLKACMPSATDANIDKFLSPLNVCMEKYQINTPKRKAAFLAQLAHESGSLRYVRELASGEDYDTRSKAASLGNTPEKDGDGQKYKGRGLIQITGRANYKALSLALNYDFIKEPEKLELPGAAALSAGWFWNLRNLNKHADLNNFERITRIINGGLNGYADRLKKWETCKKVFDVKETNY